jgi:hypothetical protein
LNLTDPLNQDRSLGYVELKVSDLAAENGDPLHPFTSTGVKNMAESIRLDKGNAYKGTLYFRAEFVPAMKLKGLKFSEGSSSAAIIEEVASDSGSVMSKSSDSSVEDDGPKQNGVTISGPTKKTHTKNSKSTDTTKTTDTTATHNTNATDATNQTQESKTDEEPGHVLSKEELLSHRMFTSLGFLVIH